MTVKYYGHKTHKCPSCDSERASGAYVGAISDSFLRQSMEHCVPGTHLASAFIMRGMLVSAFIDGPNLDLQHLDHARAFITERGRPFQAASSLLVLLLLDVMTTPSMAMAWTTGVRFKWGAARRALVTRRHSSWNHLP